MMTTGEKIKQRRKELQWSLRELADRMGYNNHSTVARIESGKVDIPQSRIVQFADVLGVSVAYLMDWEEEMEFQPVKMAERHIEMVMDEDLNDLFPDWKQLDSKKKQMLKDLAHSWVESKTEA